MLTLVRGYRDDKVIGGTLYYDGLYVCDTLENASKAIPIGTYAIEVNKSPAFTKSRKVDTYLPLICSKTVSSSRGIRIHAGNTYKDSKGCILVGKCMVVNDSYELQDGSREYETCLTDMIKLMRISLLVITE